MLFPTFDYFLFLPLVALAHWVLRANGHRTAWLLVASLAFYASWNPVDTGLLLLVIALAYTMGRVVAALREPQRGPALLASALLLLAPLLYYKYAGFLLENLRYVWPDAPTPPASHLPIGISFYSFQALAYVIDVRRGQAPEKDPLRFTTFLLFFPHLVAGPILRASNLLTQLAAERTLSRTDVGEGLARLGVGLVKKVLVADVLRLGMVDSVFTDPGSFTGLEVLVALYAYSLQIYCDFSGYTDFAIGSARLFGLRIPENFDRPYQALSVANYWRRWHMTLSDWVRDYVYHPLGGSRGGGWAPYRNTLITLLILGFWHGANWTFLVYGLVHGGAVCLNRWWRKSGPGATSSGSTGVAGVVWRWALTFHFVVLARILFRADDLTQAWALVQSLGNLALVMPRFAPHAWVVLGLGYLAHFTPTRWTTLARTRFALLPAPVWGTALAVAGWACVRWGPGDTLAFIYYDF
ncbi:MAG: MBOAT family O-acyltransferase [Pseudomonadota bacterium]|nr:MBOAT family O-acyltransferase [Pseudomonadota bacterium]